MSERSHLDHLPSCVDCIKEVEINNKLQARIARLTEAVSRRDDEWVDACLVGKLEEFEQPSDLISVVRDEARRAALEPLEALAVQVMAEHDEESTCNTYLDDMLNAVLTAATEAGLSKSVKRALADKPAASGESEFSPVKCDGMGCRKALPYAQWCAKCHAASGEPK